MTDKGRTETRAEWEAHIRATQPPEIADLLIGKVAESTADAIRGSGDSAQLRDATAYPQLGDT